MRSNYNQRAQRARQKALRVLAERHDQEFAAIHAEQRKAQGLDEIDPSRFKGDRYIQPGDPAINKFKSGPNQWPGVS